MMQFKTLTAVALTSAIVLLGACNPPIEQASTTVSGTAPVAPIVEAPKTPVLNPSNTTPQTCPAKDLQYLVGQPRTVLQTMRFGGVVRIEEPGFAYTEEYSGARTRIIIGTNGKIESIVCG